MTCLGIKEYIGANPELTHQSSGIFFDSRSSNLSDSSAEFEDATTDHFYDAISTDSSSEDEDSDDNVEGDREVCSSSSSFYTGVSTRVFLSV